MNKTFESKNTEYKATISLETLEKVSSYCKNSDGNETGGILLGYYSEDQSTAVITDITNAPIDSVFSKYTFVRGTQGLNGLLSKLWKRKIYYLGEWHLHPNSSSTASSTDEQQMKKISNDPEWACPEPLLFIVGGLPDNQFEISGYIYPKKDQRMIPLSEI